LTGGTTGICRIEKVVGSGNGHVVVCIGPMDFDFAEDDLANLVSLGWNEGVWALISEGFERIDVMILGDRWLRRVVDLVQGHGFYFVLMPLFTLRAGTGAEITPQR